MNLIPNGRVWIDTEQGAFMGYGRIQLLEKIGELGSIRKAALEMKMSYQQAWKLVTQMNQRAVEPLVTIKKGGKNGGNTQLTTFGKNAISAFKDFNLAFQIFLKEYQGKIKHEL